MSDMINVAQVRALMEGWIKRAEALEAEQIDVHKDSSSHFYRNGQRWSVRRCADELAALLAGASGAQQDEQGTSIFRAIEVAERRCSHCGSVVSTPHGTTKCRCNCGSLTLRAAAPSSSLQPPPVRRDALRGNANDYADCLAFRDCDGSSPRDVVIEAFMAGVDAAVGLDAKPSSAPVVGPEEGK